MSSCTGSQIAKCSQDGASSGCSLLAGHGTATGLSHFLGLLDECTEGAEPVHYAIIHTASLNALALPDLATDLGSGPQTDGSQQSEEAVQTAALAHSLGVLTGRQARQEVGHHTQTAVLEAAEQTLLPFSHDDELVGRSS